MLIQLVHKNSTSLTDAFMSELYFANSYFCEELLVVEAYDHFKISQKQNQ